jgi:hypothetical protein
LPFSFCTRLTVPSTVSPWANGKRTRLPFVTEVNAENEAFDSGVTRPCSRRPARLPDAEFGARVCLVVAPLRANKSLGDAETAFCGAGAADLAGAAGAACVWRHVNAPGQADKTIAQKASSKRRKTPEEEAPEGEAPTMLVAPNACVSFPTV